MSAYIQRMLSGQLDLADPVPEDVQNLLKTVLPADFHNSPNLERRSIVLNGCIWQIDTVPTNSLPQNVEEKAVLEMIEAEPNPFNKTKNGTQAEPEIGAVLANSHDL